jgi:hypothetical protein
MIAGVLVKLWLFVLRLSCSGRAFHVAFATQAQEAFLEGHVLGFEHFGAVPGRIRYDNLKPAVIRVLRGRDRAEAERFVALRSHYGSTRSSASPARRGPMRNLGLHTAPLGSDWRLSGVRAGGYVVSASLVECGRVGSG